MAQTPTLGRVVLVLGHESNGTKVHPAIVTHVIRDDMVNVLVMPNGKHTFPLTSVPLYETEAAAKEALASMDRHEAEPMPAVVAYWPAIVRQTKA